MDIITHMIGMDVFITNKVQVRAVFGLLNKLKYSSELQGITIWKSYKG